MSTSGVCFNASVLCLHFAFVPQTLYVFMGGSLPLHTNFLSLGFIVIIIPHMFWSA
jgi:hypothetical protein